MWPEQKRSGHILFQIVSRRDVVTLCAKCSDGARERQRTRTSTSSTRARRVKSRASVTTRVSA
jgi:hypothetical protein